MGENPCLLHGEDGYRLWLRYCLVEDLELRRAYANTFAVIAVRTDNATLRAAALELKEGFGSLLGRPVECSTTSIAENTLALLTPQDSHTIDALGLSGELHALGSDGYLIRRVAVGSGFLTAVAANTELGVLYGCFALLRALQTHTPLERLQTTSVPRIARRLLNHWDNIDGTIERGFAGSSLWDWFKLPDYVSPRYLDYARANASIGINGTVLNNVNSHSLILTRDYLDKVAVVAGVLRPYGIRVYLSARFSAPMELGQLSTADPLEPAVIEWWERKVAEIYARIPDFGGFLVKANSEGQPGPNDFGRNHADGANLLANALKSYGGVVLWRAFVYDANASVERHCQANLEFAPLDGAFVENAFVQVKNGPIDFQPREPFHPLFGAMKRTQLCLEFQITQEYLGNSTHLVYLGPLFKETLDAETFASGRGSSVARIVDGSLDQHADSAIAGVSNIGSDQNWCGHPFAAANWYAFGRLAWDHGLSAAEVAGEWLRMTFTNAPSFIEPVTQLMLDSREAVVNYMTPLGLHHIMACDHHQGPGPWVNQGRADWTSPYYHQANAQGLGANRTSAIAQYAPEVRVSYEDPHRCPEEFLLWFHHVSWDEQLRSGRSLWEELCWRYSAGVDSVREMRRKWESVASTIDERRAEHVRALFRLQERDARHWRDASLLYFQTFSQRPFPQGHELPERDLEYYKNMTLYYVPGIPERRFARQ